jgi:tetratricopeptide (TPR) repeat protein
MFRWLGLLFTAFQNWQRVGGPFPSARRRDTLQGIARPIPPRELPASPMRWLQTEYLLKGIYLGLVLYAALEAAAIPPGEEHLGTLYRSLLLLNGLSLGGLVLALVLATLMRIREGYSVRGRIIAYVLFLLLESPTLAYLGILGGTVAGIFLVRDLLDPVHQQALQQLLVPILGGAAVAGLAFGLLHQVQHKMLRLLLILALAAGLVAAGASWLGVPGVNLLGSITPYELANPTAFGVQLLLGIPFFYLLTFAGHEEESEVEIGAMSGMLGLGMMILLGSNKQFGSLALFLPLILYFFYTMRLLPRVRVFKHSFRGISYAAVGRHRRALQSFRRALQLDPNNRLAREGFWEVHRSLDLDKLANDPQTLALVDLDLCLDRAGALLLSKPDQAALEESQQLLELVLKIAPERHPQVDYWRAVAHTHAHQLDLAAAELERILDPHLYGIDNVQRRAVLLPAWQMALMWHEELRRRVGMPQLSHAGRRMEAIAAVERHLAANTDDPSVLPLKRLLYQDLTPAEYDAGAGQAGAAPYIDHDLLQQLGLALINDDKRWQRGGEFLRMAARGLPTLGPTLFVQIAQAHQRAGHAEEAHHNFELAKRAGQAVGQKNLNEPERQAYFATVKLLGEDAMSRGDVDAAIENYRLYSESERSGIETLRILAELYERRGDPLAAARVTDQALQYNSKDKDLLERKDRYYYSVMPDQLRRQLEHYGPGFDTAYCLTKARTILDGRYTDMDWMDVAHHLTQLALVVKPDHLPAKLLLARVQLRLGERDRAVALLEEIRGPQKPEKFNSGEDEEAWYLACQLLGDLYLELGRADLAVPALNDFRKSSKSGARTWLKLGQAFEALGELPKAVKCYKQVVSYDGNPLAPEAYEALHRLEG